MPFLENVTRGRGIPRERLEEVGRALLPLRRPQPDQRPEPGAARRAARGPRRRRASTCRSTGATATGTPTSPTRCGRWRPTGSPGRPCFVTSRPTRRTPGAGSTARTSSTPSPRSPGAPRLDKLRHYFNHPGFVEPVVDATLAALAELPDDVRDGAAPGLRHPLDPDRDGQTSGTRTPTAGRLRRASTAAWSTRSLERVRQETGRAPPARPRLLLALRARRTIPWLEPDVNDHLEAAGRRRRAGGRDGADRLRLRPHGGRLRPRHRGDGHRRAARACRPCRAATAGHRPALRRDGARPARSSGPRSSAARTSSAPAVGSLAGRAGTVCARRAAAPTRAGRATGAVRARLRERAVPTGARATSALVRRPRRPPSWSRRDAPTAASTVAATKSSDVDVVTEADRASRGADPRRTSARRGPTTRSWARRVTTMRRHQRGALDRRPDRRHRQLPLRHARSTPSRSPPSVDGEVVAGVGRRRPAHRTSSTPPTRGPRRHPRRRSRSRVRPDAAAGASGWSLTGFGYERAGARAPGRGAWPGCCRRCATSGGIGLVRARPVPRGRRPRSTATSRRASTSGTTPPRGLVAARGGRPVRRCWPAPMGLGGGRATTSWSWPRRPTAGTASSMRSTEAGFLA